MIWFTSDLHLGHQNILKHCPGRVFNNIQHMDAEFIDRINFNVCGNDELWILGDFAWCNPANYLACIDCDHVHLIPGNHDRSSAINTLPFESVAESKLLKIDGHELFLSHYAHLSWPNKSHGAIHLYGHSHRTLEPRLDSFEPDRRSMDVGVDAAKYYVGEFRPFSLDEILGYFNG